MGGIDLQIGFRRVVRPFFANPLESRDIGTDGLKKIEKYEEMRKKHLMFKVQGRKIYISLAFLLRLW